MKTPSWARLRCAWHAMRERCSSNSRSRKRYFDRGIQVCPEWESFECFNRDMGARPSPLHSLERINNDGGYSRKNCRWALRSEQARNVRSNHRVQFMGEDLCVAEVAFLLNAKQNTVLYRIRRGWTADDLLRGRRVHERFSKYDYLREPVMKALARGVSVYRISMQYGINPGQLYRIVIAWKKRFSQ